MTEHEPAAVDTWFDGVSHVLFVHAHPDDETLSTGGTIAALNACGRRASVVTMTRGERGEVVAGPLTPLEGTPQLAERRVQELHEALRVLGVAEHALLGEGVARSAGLAPRRYEDSGMRWAANGAAVAAETSSAEALTNASIAGALADLIAFVDEIGAEAIVSYDERGGYGHPDHVFTHRLARAVSIGLELPFWCVLPAGADGVEHDVSPWLAQKTAALAAHATQLTVRDGEFELSGGQVHQIERSEWFSRANG